MHLPYDRELQSPESLVEWVEELGVHLDIRQLNAYPARPLVFSEYRLAGPEIVIYRYLPMEDWLNMACQQYVGYYGEWYYLHVAHRLYYHLELSGLYEVPRNGLHRLFGLLAGTEERAYRFTRQVLGTLRDPSRFDRFVERAFQPAAVGGVIPKKNK